MVANVIDFEARDMPPEAARAFEVYRAAGAGGRSLSATADLLGVPRGTVKSWSSRYRWPQKLAAIDHEDDDGSLTAARAVAAGMRLKALTALDAILDDPAANARAKVEAARLIFDRTGMTVGAPLASQDDPLAHPDYTDAELDAMIHTAEGRAKLVELSRRSS